MRSLSLFQILLATSCLILAINADPQAICRGLILQGGSDKGAYQAGALKGLLDSIGGDEIGYDVISGVTIGGLNAAWMSQFPKGLEEPMVDELTDFWLTVKSSDMYKNWEAGPIQGLLFESSLFNTNPGSQYLKSHITQPPQRYVAIGTANANDGSFKVFHNFEQNFEVGNFLDVVQAANGIAAVFPYVNIGGNTYFDGSVLKSLDISSVVDQCRALTNGNDSAIVIDLLMLSAHKSFAEADVSKYNSIQVLIRTLELMSYQDSMIGFIRAQQSYPNINFRYVISPSKALPSGSLPFSYNHNDIQAMMAQGAQDAKDAVAKGAGVSFQEHVEFAYKKTSRGGPKTGPLLNKYFQQVNDILSKRREQIDM